MRSTVQGVLLVLITAGSGCGRSPQPTTQISKANAERRYEWTGNLFTPSELAGAMQVRGTARWTRSGDNASTAEVRISNATPGGVHPWHVQQGQCGQNGAIVGDTAAYGPLKVGNDGNASGTAKLNTPVPDSGTYHVNVHASPTNLATIISCGNLAPPVR
jgi:hypothetical protein